MFFRMKLNNRLYRMIKGKDVLNFINNQFLMNYLRINKLRLNSKFWVDIPS